MIDREKLTQIARQVEEATYWAGGRMLDGAPYDADSVFLDLAFEVLGREALREGDIEVDAYKRGVQFIESEVIKRKEKGEIRANYECGNWLMWTIFNFLGVSRVQR